MGFSESAIKRGKLVTKTFFTIMLNEEVLKSWEKWPQTHFSSCFQSERSSLLGKNEFSSFGRAIPNQNFGKHKI